MNGIGYRAYEIARNSGSYLANKVAQLSRSVGSDAYRSLSLETRTDVVEISITAIASGAFYFLQESAAAYVAANGWGICAAKQSLKVGSTVGMQAALVSLVACSIIKLAVIPSFVSNQAVAEVPTDVAVEKNRLLKRAVRLVTYFAATHIVVNAFRTLSTRPSAIIRKQTIQTQAITKALAA